jgi:hypothetical protein
MTPKHTFEYSVLQYTGDIATGEFLNVGVVTSSLEARFFGSSVIDTYKRITATFPHVDGEQVKKQIHRFQLNLLDWKERLTGSQNAMFEEWPNELAEVTSQVVPPDDLGFRFGQTLYGVSADVEKSHAHLYDRLVHANAKEPVQSRREDIDVLRVFLKPIRERKLIEKLSPTVVPTPFAPVTFEYSWRNGAENVLRALSFDMVHASNITRKARQWIGAIAEMGAAENPPTVYFLVGGPPPSSEEEHRAYVKAKDSLSKLSGRVRVQVISEDQADGFAEMIETDLEHARMERHS